PTLTGLSPLKAESFLKLPHRNLIASLRECRPPIQLRAKWKKQTVRRGWCWDLTNCLADTRIVTQNGEGKEDPVKNGEADDGSDVEEDGAGNGGTTGLFMLN